MDPIYTFCHTLYNCTYLPVHYYRNGRLQLALPITDFPFDLAGSHLQALCAKEQAVSYLITKQFHYFGLIRNREIGQMILIGPVISILSSPLPYGIS